MHPKRTNAISLIHRVNRHRRALIAVTIWIVSGVAGAALNRYYPNAFASITGDDPSLPDWAKQAMVDDPRLGEPCTLPPLYDLNGKQVRLPVTGHPTVVVFLWHCNSCGVENLILELEGLRKRHQEAKVYAVVVRGKRDVVAEFWKENRLQLPVVIDINADAARQLNAVFVSRAYVIDGNGNTKMVSGFGVGREALLRQIDSTLHTL